HRRQVFADVRARPPAVFARFGEAVAIPIRADEFWWRVRERVARKQANNSVFAFEQSLDQRKDPRMKRRRRHGGEPHLPVKLPMIRRNDAWRTVDVAGFSLELVLAPLR